jgi:hypothetical protein
MQVQLYVIVNYTRSPLSYYINDYIILLFEDSVSFPRRVPFYRSQSIFSQCEHNHFIGRASVFFIRLDFDREQTCLSKKKNCIITDPQVSAGCKIIYISVVQLDRDKLLSYCGKFQA